MRQALVLVNKIVAGTLTETDDMRYIFKYNDDYLESINRTNVYAPAIVDTINYNHDDYMRDIRNIMSKFMINFNKVVIIIADN